MQKIVIIIGILLLPLMTSSVQANEDLSTLKAAYIYNFTQFIEWPTSNINTFKIGILGSEDVHSALLALSKKTTIKQRRISVDALHAIPTNDYHIIYVDQDYSIPPIIHALENRPTLIITQQPKAAQLGAHINFFETQDHYLRFEINTASFTTSQIKISSRLLKLAKIITETPTKEGR